MVEDWNVAFEAVTRDAGLGKGPLGYFGLFDGGNIRPCASGVENRIRRGSIRLVRSARRVTLCMSQACALGRADTSLCHRIRFSHESGTGTRAAVVAKSTAHNAVISAILNWLPAT